MTPRETDEKLAELYHRLYRAQDRLAANDNHLLHTAGAKFSYVRRGRGHVRAPDMSVSAALAIVQGHAEAVAAYKTEHAYSEESTDFQGRPYTYHGTNWDAWDRPGLLPREADEPARVLGARDELEAELAGIENEIFALEATYTGWSRFFLVTSSAGHVHSSMHCSTCYAQTRYGWLPQYSGHTEDEAVAELGPTLCTVCFPSAPVEYTLGKKLTKAQAEKLAA